MDRLAGGWAGILPVSALPGRGLRWCPGKNLRKTGFLKSIEKYGKDEAKLK